MVVGLSAAMSGCGTSPAETTGQASTARPARAAAPANTTPPSLTLPTAVGAANSPSGLAAFVEVTNPSTTAAANAVTVTVTANVANGAPPTQASTQINAIFPGETVAVVVLLHPPPSMNVTSVAANVDTTTFTPSSPVTNSHTVSAVTFTNDATQPYASATLGNTLSTTLNADLVVVCTNTSGAIVGGGEVAPVVAPGAQETVHVPVFVGATPAGCRGYVRGR